jgi:hypothetical protein
MAVFTRHLDRTPEGACDGAASTPAGALHLGPIRLGNLSYVKVPDLGVLPPLEAEA